MKYLSLTAFMSCLICYLVLISAGTSESYSMLCAVLGWFRVVILELAE